ncbi:MAG: UDP-N-acetylmuramate--L-alanine ligase [Prochlorococcus sp.]|nr:UDP-N-acetylmuramate--L-alanine ligase [Prochlorococcaceae cyanobacterium ETNP18_MAG_17]MDP6321454.1 UDP-N-acetylmuramate--L-alanine ligase [Prochlorococcaceae cyanobacterium ETNP14_MAG_5]
MTRLLNRQQPIHFIGIGGIGMSALALILANRGHSVSGSDPRNSHTVERLRTQGVKVFREQSSANIKAICSNVNLPPVVVVSTAIPKSNPELKATKQAQLEIVHRSDLLAALIQAQPSIAVAGSHGKTTTSTLLTTLLATTDQDPTAVIGGVVPYYGSNGHAGQGRLLVAEADESDGSLVKFPASLGVITNLELDHTDHYSNLDELIKTMKEFGQGCRQLLANYDCPILKEHFDATAWWSVKTAVGVDFAALPICLNGNQTIADIYEQGELMGQITLPMPGLHNLSNAMAAIAACRMEGGLSFEQLKQGLADLQPPGRRFDFRGSWKDRQIVDDYAHHPSEVRATLAMARLMVTSGLSPLPCPPKRVLAVFQPHRYSRTHQFLNDFATALGDADAVLLAPVYGAGEQPIQGATSQSLAKAIKAQHPNLPVKVSEDLNQLTLLVQQHSLEGDLVLVMGAGDVNCLWSQLEILSETQRYPSSLAA